MARFIKIAKIRSFLPGALLGSAVMAALLASATVLATEEPGSGPPATPAAAQDSSLTAADCMECHEVSLSHTPHVALDRDGLVSDLAGVSVSCEACHAGAAEHQASDGDADIFSFDGTAAENSQVCLGCHADTHPRFNSSNHAKAGIGCLDCHASHVAEKTEASAFFDLGDRPSATCAGCHNEIFAQFGAYTESGHRIEEGIMECTSCHNPHEQATRVALGGFKQQKCAQCHVDKNGPWVFEHPVGRGEGCTACHSPHGSPNRHMLNFQNVAEQCFSCHAVVPGFHSRFTTETNCTNCHSQIHGSNLHPAFLQ